MTKMWTETKKIAFCINFKSFSVLWLREINPLLRQRNSLVVSSGITSKVLSNRMSKNLCASFLTQSSNLSRLIISLVLLKIFISVWAPITSNVSNADTNRLAKKSSKICSFRLEMNLTGPSQTIPSKRHFSNIWNLKFSKETMPINVVGVTKKCGQVKVSLLKNCQRFWLFNCRDSRLTQIRGKWRK